MAKETKILIVDNDYDILEALKIILSSQEYQVITAFDGEEAMEKIKNETPQLIMIDLLMPKKDGFSVCSELKESPSFKEIPIIVLTAITRDEARVRFEAETGIPLKKEFFIEKPIKPKQIISLVRKTLEEGNR